jgi:hypothetical protein
MLAYVYLRLAAMKKVSTLAPVWQVISKHGLAYQLV